MCDPDLVDGDDAGLLVDAHLHNLRRIGIAHSAADGGAAIFLAAVRFRDGRIVAGDGDGAGVLQRFGHDLVERRALVLGARAINFAEALDVLGPRLELAAAALTSTLFRLRAASSAALPTIKVTRDE